MVPPPETASKSKSSANATTDDVVHDCGPDNTMPDTRIELV